jgi:hypothetical protein
MTPQFAATLASLVAPGLCLSLLASLWLARRARDIAEALVLLDEFDRLARRLARRGDTPPEILDCLEALSVRVAAADLAYEVAGSMALKILLGRDVRLVREDGLDRAAAMLDIGARAEFGVLLRAALRASALASPILPRMLASVMSVAVALTEDAQDRPPYPAMRRRAAAEPSRARSQAA